MTDMSAIAIAFQALGGAKTIAEGLLATRDISLVGAKVVELNAKIIEAQNGIFSAQEERSTLVERMRKLEKKIADMETWNAEKQRYSLMRVDPTGVFAYALKPEASGGEEPHLLCANCYDQGEPSKLQATTELRMRKRVYYCPRCKNEYVFGASAYDHPRNTVIQTDWNPFKEP